MDCHQGHHEPQCAGYHGRLGEGAWRYLLSNSVPPRSPGAILDLLTPNVSGGLAEFPSQAEAREAQTQQSQSAGFRDVRNVGGEHAPEGCHVGCVFHGPEVIGQFAIVEEAKNVDVVIDPSDRNAVEGSHIQAKGDLVCAAVRVYSRTLTTAVSTRVRRVGCFIVQKIEVRGYRILGAVYLQVRHNLKCC